MHRKSILLLVVSLAVSLAAVPLHAQTVPPANPSYPPPSYSITIPFAEPADFSHLDKTLKLLTSVNGGAAHAFTVDTGSIGVVVPASEVPNIDPHAPAGELRYSSSGLKLTGVWTRATVRFLNPTSKNIFIEATVDVLAVTSGSCEGGGPNAGRCNGNIPHMLGVGFGRGAADGMRQASANPFLNLAPMLDGKMRHGYIISHEGVTFGLTAPETKGFQFVKLTPRTSPAKPETAPEAPPDSPLPNAKSETGRNPAPFNTDWLTAPGSITVGGHDYPMGTILMDTGLTNMIVAEPGQAAGDLPPATPVTVHLLGGKLSYTFTNGGDTSLTPRRATFIRESHGPFVNTGLHALACFDYLYDADQGYLGLRPTCAAH